MANYFRMIEETEDHIDELRGHLDDNIARKTKHLCQSECDDDCDTCYDLAADSGDLYKSINDLTDLVAMLKKVAFI